MQFRFPDGVTVGVNSVDEKHLLAEVRARLRDHRPFAIATINVDHLQRLGEDAVFRRAYGAHDLICADGNPIVWLSKIAKKPVALVPGSDLVVPLMQEAVAADVPVALVGANDDSLAKAADRLRELVPGLRVALCHAPGFPFDPDGPEGAEIIEKLRASGARLCLLALGAPRQERFAIRARDALGDVGFASIGAGLDFLSGHQQRAPKALRSIKMEWLWRMLSNPRRLAGRYARGFAILPGHLIRAARQRSDPPPR